MAEQISGEFVVTNDANTPAIILDGNAVTVTIGTRGHEGRLFIRNTDNREILRFNTGGNAALGLGAQGSVGALGIFDENNLQVFSFSAVTAGLDLGAPGKGGDLRIFDTKGKLAFILKSEDGRLSIGDQEPGRGGHLEIHNDDGHIVLQFESGEEGALVMRDNDRRTVFNFQRKSAALFLGAEGNEGDLQILDAAGKTVFNFDGKHAALYLGAPGNDGDLVIRNAAGETSIHLDGATGVIHSAGGDVAERFSIPEGTMVEPGTVMIIGSNGDIEPCTTGYDRKVVGVVAGAGHHNPALVLNARKETARWVPVSAIGKVFVKADARFGIIEMGDLLTTSPTVGHAMKASDSAQAFGAILGKALSPLKEGRGTIEMVATLG